MAIHEYRGKGEVGGLHAPSAALSLPSAPPTPAHLDISLLQATLPHFCENELGLQMGWGLCCSSQANDSKL